MVFVDCFMTVNGVLFDVLLFLMHIKNSKKLSSRN